MFRAANLLKYSFKIGKTTGETFQLLKMAYRGIAMGKTNEQFLSFRKGFIRFASEPRSGRRSASTNEEKLRILALE